MAGEIPTENLMEPVAASPSETREKTPETSAEVASEVQRLFGVFQAQAVELTDDYYKAQLAGEKGVNWDILVDRKVPILAPVLVDKGVIKLGAGESFRNGILFQYSLKQVDTGIEVHRQGRGFDPGSAFIVTPDARLLKQGYRLYDSAPTVDSSGHLAWSTPDSRLQKDNYEEVAVPTPDVLKMLEDVKKFEVKV